MFKVREKRLNITKLDRENVFTNRMKYLIKKTYK